MKRYILKMMTLVVALLPLLSVGCMEDMSEERVTVPSTSTTTTIPDDSEISTAIFEALNLDYAGLESVKAHYEAGRNYQAAYALLEYFRSRTEVAHPDVNLLNPSISPEQQQQADWALSANDYRLYIAGYTDPKSEDQAPYSWVKDKAVDWTLCPSGDEAQRYGVHRHAWFLPQALAYRTSGNETYVKEWVALHGDWIAKHAVAAQPTAEDEGEEAPAVNSNDYAWRVDEVAGRVAEYGSVMLYTMQSVNFTPAWAATFLSNLYEQIAYLQGYLFAEDCPESEGRRKEFAYLLNKSLSLFPELKEAETWRQQAVELMNDGIDPALFGVLNLDHPSLAAVKTAYDAQDYYTAANEVLNYYRQRTNVVNPNVNMNLTSVTADDQLYADYALRENGYRFYIKNYYEDKDAKKPYSFMTEEGTIDWQTMPVADQEIRYQLHRHMWMLPQAKAYYFSKDEKYVQGWIEVFLDWFKQNPRPTQEMDFSIWPGNLPAELQNYGWTWRSLDVAARLIDHCAVLEYVKSSQSISAAFWLQFLTHIASEADHIMHNYSADSNHLITQAQAVTQVGVLLPELKGADEWVASGAGVLQDCVKTQYFADGWLKDADFQYHVSAIEDFRSAMYFAQQNGREDVFSAEYKESLRKMTQVVKHMIYPDYSSVNMADTRKSSWSKSVLKKNLNRYVELFPEDEEMRWLATEGKEGTMPTATSAGFSDCGYYVVRSGWTKEDLMMVVSNTTQSPQEQWHLQWDNGNFELYAKGRHFFPDSGCNSYGGSSESNARRNKYAATTAHNTLTLNSANITTCRGELLRLDYNKTNKCDRLVMKNKPYEGLTHRRSIFLVEGKFYVVVDEAYGAAAGTLNLNLNPGESEENVVLDADAMGMHTTFADNNNMVVRSFTDAASMTFREREGFYSTAINQEVKRKAYALDVEKEADKPVRFITVFYPAADATTPQIKAQFSGDWTAARCAVKVTIDGTEYSLVNTSLTE